MELGLGFDPRLSELGRKPARRRPASQAAVRTRRPGKRAGLHTCDPLRLCHQLVWLPSPAGVIDGGNVSMFFLLSVNTLFTK